MYIEVLLAVLGFLGRFSFAQRHDQTVLLFMESLQFDFERIKALEPLQCKGFRGISIFCIN